MKDPLGVVRGVPARAPSPTHSGSQRWETTICCFLAPAADSNCLKVPEGIADLDVLFLTDILPTAWHANEMGEVHEGDVVAIWGAGPGQ